MLKTLATQISRATHSRHGERNLRVLARFFVALAVMITVYSVFFHVLMLREGQEHTWLTGFYWTLTVMSTLGFGDITFHTDLGRMFSILVLMSGTLFLLVLLPFTFIEFFYEPWMTAQAAARAPKQLPETMGGHVLLTSYEAVGQALVRRLRQYQYDYALLVPEVEEALRLHDMGLNVMVGDLDDPETWSRARAEAAAMVFAGGTDVANTAIAFTVRAKAPEVPIVTVASDEASVDILKLAGSNLVLRLEEMIGTSFAGRTVGGDAVSHVIGRFDEVLIAEATARRTPLVGKTLLENALRDKVGVSVVGTWKRGHFDAARPETVVSDDTVLVLAGSQENLARYDELFGIYNLSSDPVVVLGGGRVGRATARALKRRGLDYRVVEKVAERVVDPAHYVVGSAAALEVLEEAGIREAPAVIITTGEDDLNVYLTIYCRQLRPDVQILSRATQERNVAALHRAGADSVLSYSMMGVSRAMNVLQRGRLLTVAEGLDLFNVRVPAELAGRRIKDSTIRERTGCSVVAVRTAEGMKVIPSPSMVLPADAEIVLIGTGEAEQCFLETPGFGAPSARAK